MTTRRNSKWRKVDDIITSLPSFFLISYAWLKIFLFLTSSVVNFLSCTLLSLSVIRMCGYRLLLYFFLKNMRTLNGYFLNALKLFSGMIFSLKRGIVLSLLGIVSKFLPFKTMCFYNTVILHKTLSLYQEHQLTSSSSWFHKQLSFSVGFLCL